MVGCPGRVGPSSLIGRFDQICHTSSVGCAHNNCGGSNMLIDCNECSMQHTLACRDCVVGHLLHDLVSPIELDEDRAEALDVLADAGLVPQLRLLPRTGTD